MRGKIAETISFGSMENQNEYAQGIRKGNFQFLLNIEKCCSIFF